MFLISELLGISFGEADLYRRALENPKKDKKGYVQQFHEKSVTVGVERGFKKEICELVRDLIIENSGYGFNKSHLKEWHYLVISNENPFNCWKTLKPFCQSGIRKDKRNVSESRKK